MGRAGRSVIDDWRSLGVLADTNLLLLYFVGVYRPGLIASFGRTRGYSAEDFEILRTFLEGFARVFTTPHILTEFSNLAGTLRGDHRSGVFDALRLGLGRIEEHHIPGVEIARSPHLEAFGLTDLGIVEFARGRCLVLTDDLRAASYMAAHDVDVINFNQVRSYAW